jgi:microcystin-dependent protein
MATLTKGKTFVNGELVTPANLHQMVDAATVANIVNADIAAAAAIADTKLAQIATLGKVANSATTATNASTANAIVARDGSGNFSAGTITANLTGNVTGNASTATILQTARTINGVSFNGSANITVTATPDAHTHDDRYYTETEMNTLLNGKQASGSYAPATGIAQSAVTNLTTDLAGKAASSHTHDDLYYTETEMNTLLNGKQASGSYAPATGIAPSAITGTAVITTDSRLVPAGAVMPFAMNSAPSGWLQANGDLVSRSTYSALFSSIGTTYGSGDGSTTFDLPDLRGYFLRGSGTNIDGTVSGNFGSKQSDDVKPHAHAFSLSIQSLVLSVQELFGMRSTGGNSQTVSDINVSTGSPTVSASISSNIGAETRPKNIAMMYCIKT